MFVRVVRVKEYRYMQVVQNVRIKGKAQPVHEHLWSIGRYDERVLAEARRLLRELVDMGRGPVVIAELEEASGPSRRNSFFSRYRWRS
jgi:hypothetical protein